jgi:hypothetical protein
MYVNTITPVHNPPTGVSFPNPAVNCMTPGIAKYAE